MSSAECVEGLQTFWLHMEGLFTLSLDDAIRSVHSSHSRDTINFSMNIALINKLCEAPTKPTQIM